MGDRIFLLDALLKETDKKIFLILDNLRVHHSKPVKAWLAQHYGFAPRALIV